MDGSFLEGDMKTNSYDLYFLGCTGYVLLVICMLVIAVNLIVYSTVKKKQKKEFYKSVALKIMCVCALVFALSGIVFTSASRAMGASKNYVFDIANATIYDNMNRNSEFYYCKSLNRIRIVGLDVEVTYQTSLDARYEIVYDYCGPKPSRTYKVLDGEIVLEGYTHRNKCIDKRDKEQKKVNLIIYVPEGESFGDDKVEIVK